MPQAVTKDLGPCICEFDSVRVGPSHGAVLFRYSEIGKETFEDEYGETPVDEIIVGAAPTEVEFPMTRQTLAQLNTVLANSAVAPADEMNVSNPVGISLYEKAKQLVIKPIVDNVVSTNSKNWLTLLKAAPKVEAELSYDKDGQRVVKVLFKGFPVQESGSTKGRIWKIG